MDSDEEKILEELKNNPKAQRYLEPYDEHSVKHFLDDYAFIKKQLLTQGDVYRKFGDHDNVYYRNCAENYYWQIAHKKLFNLQCLWRAEQIDLPIEVTYEFSYWGKNIQACPYIDPATDEELEALVEFLDQSTYDDGDDQVENWQDHYEFKDESIGPGEYYPSWYEWYDSRFGTGHLMLLPDTRGDYENACLKARTRSLDEKEPMEYVEPKPYLDPDQMEDFIKQIEPYKIVDSYRYYQEWMEKNEKMEGVEHEMERLMADPDEVIIPEGKFPEAIFQAAHLLKIKKVKRLLSQIHQDHLDRLSMGISYELEETVSIEDARRYVREGKKILEGK